MRIVTQQLLLSLTLPLVISAQIQVDHLTPANIGVVNVIPSDQSPETDHNAEPSLAVSSLTKAVIYSLTPNRWDAGSPVGTNLFFSSYDGGTHWFNSGTFSGGGGTLDWNPAQDAYAAVAFSADQFEILNSPDPTTGFDTFGPSGLTPPNRLKWSSVPWMKAANVADAGVVLYAGYVGPPFGPTLTSVEKPASVVFSSTVKLDLALTSLDHSPAVRLAISASGDRVYAVFQRINDYLPTPTPGWDFQGDVVLMRAGHIGLPMPPGIFLQGNGTKVAEATKMPYSTRLGLVQPIYAAFDVAVNPGNQDDVYVAYTRLIDLAPDPLPVLDVMHSSDGGASFNRAFSRTNASLPGLAITSDGTVGLLFAQWQGTEMQIHFFKAYKGDFSIPAGQVIYSPWDPLPVERVLAVFRNSPSNIYDDVFMGDHLTLTAVGNYFYGAFTALGTPTPDNFPCGAYFQRFVKVGNVTSFNTPLTSPGTLVDFSDNEVPVSFDPFIFYDYSTTRELRSSFKSRRLSLAWPALADHNPQLQLETSPLLGPDATWMPFTNAPIVQTNGEFVTTVDVDQDQQYFRLRQDVDAWPFQLFTSAGKGGTLSPTGTNAGILVEPGNSSEVFSATPDSDYQVGNWYVDGVLAQSGNTTFGISNINADHTVVVTFAPSHDLTVTAAARNPLPELPFLTGSNFDYVVILQNTGVNPLSDVQMADFLPPGVSFVHATTSQGSVGEDSGVVDASIGSLSPGASAKVVITVAPGSEGILTNSVEVACDEVEPDLDNNFHTELTPVLVPAAITNQPASQSVITGATVNFDVGVTGTPPFLYQWAFNGVDIAGATSSSLNLTNVTAADIGAYQVTVSQRSGRWLSYEVGSSPADLDVSP